MGGEGTLRKDKWEQENLKHTFFSYIKKDFEYALRTLILKMMVISSSENEWRYSNNWNNNNNNNNNNNVEHAGDNYTNCNRCVWNSN